MHTSGVFWAKEDIIKKHNASRAPYRKKTRRLSLEQLEDRRLLTLASWHNFLLREDVNGDNFVTPLDALLIINELNTTKYGAPGTGRLPIPGGADSARFGMDISCDGFVSPIDALRVINALNAQQYTSGLKFTSTGGYIQPNKNSPNGSCAPRLVESNSFGAEISADFIVPNAPSALEVQFSDLSFDTTDDFINDAFEAALVDERGTSLVHKIAGSRDAFFNITEGQTARLGANTLYSGDRLKVDIAHVAPGTKAKLVLRLVNNDGDEATSVQISNFQVISGALGTPAGVSGAASSLLQTQAAIDFDSLADVTSSMSVDYGLTSFEPKEKFLQADLAIRNAGGYSLNGPIVAVIDHLSDPSIRVFNADGFTPEGQPYFNLNWNANRVFQSNDVTASRQLLFKNPNAVQFTYDLVVLGQVNRPPVILSEAITEAIVGREYRYPILAQDPDNDPLSYSLLVGPTSMVLDGNTLKWTATGNVGSQAIVLRVTDGRGGVFQQQFTLNVIDPPPNRPPVFTSTPVVDANAGSRYIYDALALDPDRDPLSFRLLDSISGMQVDSQSGQITWTPASTDSGRTLPVSLVVDDGRGGVATQTFRIQVQSAVGNHPPQIVSMPATKLFYGEHYTQTVLAVDPDADALAYSLLSGPDGMSIDPSTGLITWQGSGAVGNVLGPAPTNGLALTAEATAAGYHLTEFARNFPSAIAGPLGVAFPASGGVLVSDYPGNVRRFTTGTDGHDASTITPAQAYGFNQALDMAQLGSDIYMVQRAGGTIVQLNDDGTLKQTIVSGLATPLGMAVNPINGHLIVSSDASNIVYDVDPISKTASILFHAALDGISINSDGSILYGAGLSQGRIYGYSLVAGSVGDQVFDSGHIDGMPDGAVPGGGELAGKMFVNTNQGTVVAIDLQTKQQTIIAAGGSRGDFVKVDPTNGTLLLTQTDTLARLHLPAGSSFTTDHDISVRVDDGKGGFDVQDFRLQLANVQRGEIRGTKFHDLNADGLFKSDIASVSVEVPGPSNPWLAGMPDGSTDNGVDSAPAQSPVHVAGLGLIPETILTFLVSGSVSYGGNPIDPPDGDVNFFLPHGYSVQNGISDVVSTANSLVALFLGPDQPNLTPAPTRLDFRTTDGNVVGGIDYLTLAPQLKQVFFVGDGVTTTGLKQQVIVPHGATRLFLGTMDGFGWFNNAGAFAVTVTAVQPEPGLAGWTIYLDENSNGARDPHELSTVTDEKGEYAFTDLSPGTYVVAEELNRSYDAVRDFTVDANPNGPWTYGYSQTRGSEFQSSTITGETASLEFWSATNGGPHILHNRTGSVIPGGITYPADALNLDPSFDGRNSVLRFTAPRTDTYHLKGRFQGIDRSRGTTTDVAILKNSQSIFAGDINGFYTDDATTPGAILYYDLQVTAMQGDTIDFSVGQGAGGSFFDSTGVSAIIVGTDWRQTAPASKTHQITVVAGEVRKNIDFGNLEVAAVPPENQAPRITSTPVLLGQVGTRYRSQASAVDVDGDRLTFDLPVSPSGMVVDARRGTIVWTPTADQAGVQNVILRVRDGRGGLELQSFEVVVSAANSGPRITSQPSGPAQANLPYQYRIRAQDAEGDPITFGLRSKPIGNMAVNPTTGVFTWLPSAGDIGAHTIEVTAIDPSGAGQIQTFELQVVATAPNREPVISSTPREQVRLGNNYVYAVEASDPDGDPLSYLLDVGPTGMSIDALGLIVWTPSGAQFADNPVKLRVTDGRGGEQIQSFTIAVLSQSTNHPPVITSTAALAATVGIDYRYAVKATDVDGDTLAYSLQKSPNGMSIDPLSGAVRWTPTADQLGAQHVIVRVSDTAGEIVTQSFTITVRGTNLPPEISSAPRTTASVGRAYSYALRASDPEGSPLTYSLSAKSGDMSIDASGTIHWLPTAAEVGHVAVKLRVSDDQGASVEQSYTVVVAANAPNQPPVITSSPILVGSVGQAYLYQVTATDPDGDPLRFAFLEVPNGMTIDQATGLIRWTSDQPGIGRVTVLVNDFSDGDAEQSFEVTIEGFNLPPAITSTPIVKLDSGATYGYDVRAHDPNMDPLSFVLDAGPSGLSIDANGRITWTTEPTDAGTKHIKVTVSDDRGLSAVQEYDLVVTPDTEAPKLRIQVSSNPIALDDTLVIQVNASDNTGVKTLNVTVAGMPVALDSRGRASVLMSQVGTIQVAAVATDASGNTGRQTTDVLVINTNVTEAPTVDVTSPGENATITAPTDVIGTVQDANLVSWKLEVAQFESGDFIEIASGTNPIANSKIATFDPTLLQNDSYILRLSAVNSGGLSSSIDTVVNVSGNLKLGNFTLSFTDLSIPVAGIPITVSRTYDTLTANQDGELGFGWKLVFRNVDLRTSLPKTGDESGGLYTPFRDGTRVYVTLPGGKREGFTFKPKAVGLFDPHQRERDVPAGFQSGNGFNAVYFVPNFVPDKGVTAKLSVNRFQLSKRGNEYFQFGGGLPYNPNDPAYGGRFKLSTVDGINYSIDAEGGVLLSATSSSGNSLIFTGDGIANSGGGKVVFERDAQGRISSVSDLEGRKITYSYSSSGDLTVVSDRQNAATKFEYGSLRPHYLDKVVDPLNRTGLRAEFDANGKLIKTTNGVGSSVAFAYDPLHSIQSVTNARGFTTAFTYDADGNIISETDPLGNTTTRSYDASGNLLSETDPLGHTRTTTYDESGRVLTETDAIGNVRRFTYRSIDVPGFGPTVVVENEMDTLGNTLHNIYDSQGQLVSTTDAFGNSVHYTYDANGRITSSRDGQGHSTQNIYDNQGNLSSSIDTNGHRTNYSYSRNGIVTQQTTTKTNSQGASVEISQTVEIDANDRPTQLSSVSGRVVSLRYDATGNPTQFTNSTGSTIGINADSAGARTGIEFPDGTHVSTNRDPNGNVTSYQDRQGRLILSEFDAADRLIKTTYPDGSFEAKEYDAAGRLVAQIDANGNRTAYSYDANNWLIATTDALGNVTSTTYDASGTTTSETDANGFVTRYEYDLSGNRSRVVYPDGTTRESSHDNVNNVSTLTDEAGRLTKFEVSPTGAIHSIIDAAGNRTSFTYDELGQMTSQTDANNHVTRWEFNDAGALQKTILPLGMSETSTFGTDGHLTNVSNYNGVVTEYTYDLQNRVTKVVSGGNTIYSLVYSGDHLTTSQDPRGVTKYSYDDRDRLIKVEHPDGQSIQYEYDRVGNRTSVSTQAGKVLYGYNQLNRLVSVTDPTGLVTRYRYDAVGNIIETQFPNNVVESRTYDSRNRLTNLRQQGPNGLLQSYTYTLDKLGRRIEILESTGRHSSYTYDVLGRLTREQIVDPQLGNSTIDYLYDPVGNRLSRNDSTKGLTTYTYDANDRLISETSGALVTQYTYDNDGNLISRSSGSSDGLSNVWNGLDQLISTTITDATGTHLHSFKYDPSGLRVSVTVDGTETRFIWDAELPTPEIIMQYDAAGQTLSSYSYGLSRISQDQNNIRNYYLTDGLGSIRMLVNDQATITDQYTFDAFGTLIASSGVTNNVFRFAGEQFDAASSTYYLRARQYQPSNGRFWSTDTVPTDFSRTQTTNRYVYTENDPANRIDPSGLASLVSQLSTVAIRNTLTNLNLRQTAGIWLAAGLNGLYTTVAFARRSHDWHKITAIVGGVTVSRENSTGLGVSGGIDQLAPVVRGHVKLLDNYPTVFNVGAGAPITRTPPKPPRYLRKRPLDFISGDEHAGVIWKQGFPVDSFDAQTAVGYSFNEARGSLSSSVSAKGSTGVSISVGLFGGNDASYGFQISASAVITNKSMQKVLNQLRVVLRVPSGLSSQIGFSFYVGDLPSGPQVLRGYFGSSE